MPHQQPISTARHAASSFEDEASSVLSTLNDDGSRRWIRPRPSFGRFLSRRRVTAWGLIALFTSLPHISINGKPAILLDLVTRRFTFFGVTLLPSDTLIMALLMVAALLSIFFFTALFGRVWCGWACPQTVYLEFVFRPIERLFRGTPGRANKGRFVGSPLAVGLQYVVYVIIAALLAHTFLAYFVGVSQLSQWVRQSPLEHPTPFLVMSAVTGLMLFDFAFFREQTCLVACPYGRLQSVLLDRQSLIVAYDFVRGEPRGKAARAKDVALPLLASETQARGDCVDCGLCVATCPTGIDIRKGLQMECVHCTQCIDACSAVMSKLNRPQGLIRYTSQASLAGETKRVVRPRVFIYPALVLILLVAAATVFAMRGEVNVSVMRSRGATYIELEDGTVANQVRIKLISRAGEPRTYTLNARAHGAAEQVPLSLTSEENPYTLSPGASHTIAALIHAPTGAFKHGSLVVDVLVLNEAGEAVGQRTYTLMGPTQAASGNKRSQPSSDTPTPDEAKAESEGEPS